MAPPQLQFTTLDVFTTTKFAGNPLAVVQVPPDARSQLTQEDKQRIAREFNLSETVFLYTGDDEAATSRDISIFTIFSELPFAGHPTVGTATLVLKELGWSHVDTLVTKAGPIKISPVAGGMKVQASIPHDVHFHKRTLGVIMDDTSLGDAHSIIRQGLSDDPEIRQAELSGAVVSIVKGMTFVLVELPSLEHLAKVNAGKRIIFKDIMPNLLDEGSWSESFVSRYYYVAEADESSNPGLWKGQTRMVELDFEDPATGSAACTLASYLSLSGKASLNDKDHVRFEIVQGVEMGRRSEIFVTISTEQGGAKIKELVLEGAAVPVMEGTI